MPVYEWQRRKPLGVDGGGRVEEGQTFRAPEEVGRAFGDLTEEVDDTGQDVDVEVSFNRGDDAGDGDGDANGGDDDADAGDETGDETPEEAGDPTDAVPPEEVGDDAQDLLDGNVEEVTDAVESGDWDDRLQELLAAERRGSDRKTVREAIRDRLGDQGRGGGPEGGE